MGELEAFYARRRRVTFVICLASALQAILFGSSVLIEGLLTTFDEPPEPGRRTYAFHGLYAKVLITPVAVRKSTSASQHESAWRPRTRRLRLIHPNV